MYGDCFASSAIRSCRVDTGSSFEALAMFPSNGSLTRHPLPSTGFPRGEFPGFIGTMRRSDSLPPSRLASFRFARQYRDVRLCFAPAGLARVTDGPGVGDPAPDRRCAAESAGRPKFLENPGAAMPCSSTPAGPTPLALTVRRCCPRAVKNEGSKRVVISGLYSTALLLAVYASPRPLRSRDARLASGCWLSFTGWDWSPTGFQREVSKCGPYISSSSPKLSWRNDSLRRLSRGKKIRRNVPE